MSSRAHLRRHTRATELANVQKLAARAASIRARFDEEEALATLGSATGERDQTLQLWQARFQGPPIDPTLIGQLMHALATNEAALDRAGHSHQAAQVQVGHRQQDLGQAEVRHKALKRGLARTRRRLSRKREETALTEQERQLQGGAQP